MGERIWARISEEVLSHSLAVHIPVLLTPPRGREKGHPNLPLGVLCPRNL